MARHTIRGADWRRIKELLPTRGPKADNRKFVNAVNRVGYTARTNRSHARVAPVAPEASGAPPLEVR